MFIFFVVDLKDMLLGVFIWRDLVRDVNFRFFLGGVFKFFVLIELLKWVLLGFEIINVYCILYGVYFCNNNENIWLKNKFFLYNGI